MWNKRNMLLLWGVCLVAVLCAACSKEKGNPVNSDGHIGSSTSQTVATSQQTHGSGDNEVDVGDIGESTQTHKDKGEIPGRTSEGKHNNLTSTKPSLTNTTAKITLESSMTGSTTSSTTTCASPVTTDQDGFFPGHR